MRMSFGRLASAAVLAAGIGALAIPAAAQAAPYIHCDTGGSSYICDFDGGSNPKWYVNSIHYPGFDGQYTIYGSCRANTVVRVSVTYTIGGTPGQVNRNFVCNPGDWP
ncbi:hypothetical protein [Longispora albida]|uniref:hypothetical protein n=1 Tax=Longispora albida TaxID=203523 RepID=UPI0003A9DEAE|nr:hypothetical protein [Longispora albida]